MCVVAHDKRVGMRVFVGAEVVLNSTLKIHDLGGFAYVPVESTVSILLDVPFAFSVVGLVIVTHSGSDMMDCVVPTFENRF